MSKSDPTILLKQLKVRPKNKSVNKKKEHHVGIRNSRIQLKWFPNYSEYLGAGHAQLLISKPNIPDEQNHKKFPICPFYKWLE